MLPVTVLSCALGTGKITAMFDAALGANEEIRKGKISWKPLPDLFPIWGEHKQAA